MTTGAPGIDQGVPNEDQGPAILGATLTVTIAALITMVTRLFVRIRMIRNVGWDDYVMVSSMILCIVGQIIIIPEVHLGAGRHKEYIDASDFANGFKLNFITQILYLFAICLVKLSVGFFLLRIAVTRVYRRIIIGVMAFMAFYTIGCFFTLVLQCTNLAVQWDPTATGTCWPPHTIKALSYTNVTLNVFTDILLSFAIPIPLLWGLQMNKPQRLSLICVFGLGIFATAAALARITFLTSYGKTADWLWDSSNLTIWAVVESNIGIIAGNLPCLKPLFRAVLGSTYGRGSHKTTVPPTYSHASRPYESSTGQQSVNAKGWSALASTRTVGRGRDNECDVDRDVDRDTEFPRSYSTKGSYLLTTINADRDRDRDRDLNPTRASMGAGADAGESTRKSSQEGLTRMPAPSGFSGIKVETEVNVVESPSASDFGFVDAERREGRDCI
ncbi:uncharacterized protein EKO05_0010129 [Ascochyta rabiei]|uniref:Uncharacterized protein n=1 Tax=Didymella rabiei TaxID=5454 RepID=A0A163MEV4_DIDRA|nr:uncharacterized protein EKO05_0010129 [Ascochyta rabiei]KZM28652.1 hypothetical protein ST47_g186 [Ascochyta rabiei]UPX19879.1 hypothetical protein EKO05_0010129 [Ascochyta rabiei]